jgi:hypothetical protein
MRSYLGVGIAIGVALGTALGVAVGAISARIAVGAACVALFSLLMNRWLRTSRRATAVGAASASI